jgi:hypothetical protein
VILGTTELLTAFTSLAPRLMIPACSESLPTMKPVTSWRKRRGMFIWFTSRMNRAALSAASA